MEDLHRVKFFSTTTAEIYLQSCSFIDHMVVYRIQNYNIALQTSNLFRRIAM